ncbi:major facilitator superfamily domain-containing protein, partial [Dimargaris cristalligena]
TARQKIWMTTLVSLAGATSSLSSTIYLPAIELIEDDFDTTSVMMKLSVSLYFAGGAIGPLVWGPLSDVGGRKWAYILSYGIYTLACIGLALAPNVQILLLFRFFQALGASSATPVGTGTICDLYAKDQRGVALGLFLLGSLLGPMIGPLVGGLTADTIGWRWSFWILAIYGGFLWLLIAFTVPETHRTLVAEASGAHMTQLRPLPYTLANTSLFSPARWRFNPLRPLFFLKYPFVVTTVFNISIIYSSLFCVSASMPHNFAALYDMAPSTIGLTFISVGVGSIFGSLIGGQKKDLEEEEENASTISTLPDLLLNPQFRLRSGLFFSWLMPTTILLYGLFLHFGFPLASLMVVEFFFGYSMTHMYASYCNFLTDVFLTDSATVTSLYNCMRSLVSTLAVVLEEIVEETWGVHGAFALLAGVHVIGAALMFFTYYRTPKWMER